MTLWPVHTADADETKLSCRRCEQTIRVAPVYVFVRLYYSGSNFWMPWPTQTSIWHATAGLSSWYLWIKVEHQCRGIKLRSREHNNLGLHMYTRRCTFDWKAILFWVVLCGHLLPAPGRRRWNCYHFAELQDVCIYVSRCKVGEHNNNSEQNNGWLYFLDKNYLEESDCLNGNLLDKISS